MPTVKQKIVDVWACNVCYGESRDRATATECEDGHIAALEDIRKQREGADVACRSDESSVSLMEPRTAWEKNYYANNHRWLQLNRLVLNAEAVVAKRKAAVLATDRKGGA